LPKFNIFDKLSCSPSDSTWVGSSIARKYKNKDEVTRWG